MEIFCPKHPLACYCHPDYECYLVWFINYNACQVQLSVILSQVCLLHESKPTGTKSWFLLTAYSYSVYIRLWWHFQVDRLPVHVALWRGDDHQVLEVERGLDDAVAELQLLLRVVHHVSHLNQLPVGDNHLKILPLKAPTNVNTQGWEIDQFISYYLLLQVFFFYQAKIVTFFKIVLSSTHNAWIHAWL